MSTQGYYRYPTLFKDQLVFVSEDDLWRVPALGGIARRLTSGAGSAAHPCFSPDGKWIAYTGSAEGHSEVYLMPSEGGPTQRLTFLGETVQVLGWQGDDIYFASTAGEPFFRVRVLWKISFKGGDPEKLPFGPVNMISFKNAKSPSCVIQRHGYKEYGFWKRYRGGTAGEVWIDEKGKGEFKKLLNLKSDMARPLWVKDRIYFTSDHEGIGNIYSCLPSGQDLQRHTHHLDFYVRNLSTDGTRLVYHAGGDLFLFDPQNATSHKVEIEYHSAREKRNRKFVCAASYLEDYTLHPNGHHLGLISRGKPFLMGNWEGAAIAFGEEKGVRYRLLRWLSDGKRGVILRHDREGEFLEIYDLEKMEKLSESARLDLGRVMEFYPSPKADEALLVNHRSELLHLNLKTWKCVKLDRSEFGMIRGLDWSPDGQWVAYNCTLSRHQSCIKLVNIKTKKITPITKPVLRDVQPSFDPEGRYLYFLSYREFHPEWDSLHFDLNFPCGMRPYVMTLRKDLSSPFQKHPKELGLEVEEEDKKDQKGKEKDSKKNKAAAFQIDLEGIEDRIHPFPIETGIYSQVVGMKGKVLVLSWPILRHQEDENPSQGGLLEAYDFESQKLEEIAHDVQAFQLSLDKKTVVLQADHKLRVIKAGEKPEEGSDPKPSPKSGWIDLSRARVSVDPPSEWRQIYQEAWRLQKDYFWVEDMSQINWQIIFDRYWPLIDRISNRSELNDIMWEMQGELGTSHAYVVGGDIEQPPRWTVGSLAADWIFDPKKKAYKITKIVKGDPWNLKETSPLTHPGVNVKEGDLIWAVNGRPVSEKLSPQAMLVHFAGQEISLTLSDNKGKNKRVVLVKTLANQGAARYREWVESNRAYVHQKTKGRVGYIHIPDMSLQGFAEFHRGFLSENDREGLIIDVRFNGGGNVSSLILEKLARRRLGYDVSRWFGIVPYPEDSPAGPLVALTNEYAGSDGDIFSHAFKALKLGPLIGKRTWGGVIGIWPRQDLVDGGYTTQPEFSFWFFDVGWQVENYGVEPDIVVENRPQDYQAGLDPQLDRSIQEILDLLKKNPPQKPNFSKRPYLGLPTKLG